MTQKQQRKKHTAKLVKHPPISDTINKVSMLQLPGNVTSQLRVLPTKATQASHRNPGLNVICKLIQNILCGCASL